MTDAFQTLVISLVVNPADYGSAVLYDVAEYHRFCLPSCMLVRDLSTVFSFAVLTMLVILVRLHWLRVGERITY